MYRPTARKIFDFFSDGGELALRTRCRRRTMSAERMRSSRIVPLSSGPEARAGRSLHVAGAALGFLLSVTPLGASAAVTPFPALASDLPLGSLVYDATVMGTIQMAGATETFTIDLDAGQTASVLVEPTAAGLQPTVELRDPSSSPVGIATAAGAGQDALLQTVAAAPAGTYSIIVGGAASSTGGFAVRFVLNAAVEFEPHGGPTNDTIATAQDLSASFIPLTSTADRGAALGVAVDASDPDFFSFGLNAGQIATLVLEGAGSSPGLELQGSSGSVLATATSGAANVDLLIADFVAPGTGTYYAHVTGTGSYLLLVTRAASFDTEPNDPQSTAQSISATRIALGHVHAPAAVDFYSFPASAGDQIQLSTLTPAAGPGEFPNTLDPLVELFDPSGNPLGSDDNSGPDGRNALLKVTAPVTGVYAAQVRGAQQTGGEYVLVLTLGDGSSCSNGEQCASGFCVDGACCNEACTGAFRACNLPGQLGVCSESGLPGHPCSDSMDCQSPQVCADGVCCDSNCNQPCQACNLPGSEGTCSPFPGPDEPLCAGTMSCSAAGECRLTDGQSCVGPAECASGFCTDGVCCDKQCAGATEACNVPGNVGTCAPTGANGDSCSDAAQCESTNCADGVCCDTPCDGPMEQCNLRGRVGTCTDITAPVPTTSLGALLIGLGLLVAIAAFALARRRGLAP